MKSIIKYMYHGEPISLKIEFENKEEMNEYDLDLLNNDIKYNGLCVEIICDRDLDHKTIPEKNIDNQLRQFLYLDIIKDKLSLFFESEIKDDRLLRKYLKNSNKKTFPFLRVVRTNEKTMILKQFFFDPFFKKDLITISGLRDFSLNLDLYYAFLKDLWIFYSKDVLLSTNKENIVEIVTQILKEIRTAKNIWNSIEVDTNEGKYKSTVDFSLFLKPLNQKLIYYLKKESE